MLLELLLPLIAVIELICMYLDRVGMPAALEDTVVICTPFVSRRGTVFEVLRSDAI